MEEKLLRYWAESAKVPYDLLVRRMKKDHMGIDKALFTSVKGSPWRSYKNGNVITAINLDDGTKIHSTINPDSTDFYFCFAENSDVNITNKCDNGCPWCYLNCKPNSPHGDLLNVEFLNTLHPYTELAINGNDLTHPQLLDFLKLMKKKKNHYKYDFKSKSFLKKYIFC